MKISSNLIITLFYQELPPFRKLYFFLLLTSMVFIFFRGLFIKLIKFVQNYYKNTCKGVVNYTCSKGSNSKRHTVKIWEEIWVITCKSGNNKYTCITYSNYFFKMRFNIIFFLYYYTSHSLFICLYEK